MGETGGLPIWHVLALRAHIAKCMCHAYYARSRVDESLLYVLSIIEHHIHFGNPAINSLRERKNHVNHVNMLDGICEYKGISMKVIVS